MILPKRLLKRLSKRLPKRLLKHLSEHLPKRLPKNLLERLQKGALTLGAGAGTVVGACG
jgi:hypothetical protein